MSKRKRSDAIDIVKEIRKFQRQQRVHANCLRRIDELQREADKLRSILRKFLPDDPSMDGLTEEEIALFVLEARRKAEGGAAGDGGDGS